MVKIISLTALTVFFAMNMGASGIAPSFAAACGSRTLKKRYALLLFTAFVILGAVLLGRNVSLTLGRSLLPPEFLKFDTALAIIFAASLSLFLANLFKIPQSTSQVTVAAIAGAGIYFRHLYLKTLFFKIIPMWIILPLASYLVTFLLYRLIYPPRQANLRIYERVFRHERKLKLITIIVSCYVAFAIGSNNAANAVGPLYGAGIIGLALGLVLVAPIFGLGAWALGSGPLKTAGKEIVPLGMVSSTLVSFVTASLLLVASTLGIPQSLVQLNICSIFAISSLKNGHRSTLDLHITKKTFVIWALTPVLAMLTSYLVLWFTNSVVGR